MATNHVMPNAVNTTTFPLFYSYKMSRPEHTAPPEIFFNEREAIKYTNSSRIIEIQEQLTQRAVQLLSLPDSKPAYLLDIGCGSGLSGEVLDEYGHTWVGVDIAPAMLSVANERDVQGDLFLQDIGHGFGFRAGSFDGAVSISVIQWLCNADKKANNPYKRLARFFSTLYIAIQRGGRAVFQLYPENDDQVHMITTAAIKAGFSGGLVVDYPNSAKAKKSYLCLFAGQGNQAQNFQLPQGLTGDECVAYTDNTVSNQHRSNRSGKAKNVKDKQWILRKKDQMRMRGKKKVANDSKYTGRKRHVRF